ncbi:hypothetical protein CA13_08730 [Planctomycetes bacterium CA13]|uniref:Uncharacterized protein n=1 Tax=Novipirellula herctigrandis TaxID=2527986 RepID=A0A5C5YWT4_9BACT|nr:hypothetical protein CA13_08730 [Planctomycetes bacterium CA13]
MPRCLTLLFCCLLGAFFRQDVRSAEYRVDSQQVFDHLKAKTFMPGDSILFKKGIRFTGMFNPKGTGREGKPIIIDAYGKGDLPVINANGTHRAGLLLRDPSFWEVNRLEITNTNGSDDDQGELFGIYVLADGSEGVFEHIYINDCFIHDVNGKVAGKQRGGIHVHIKKLKASRFHDLRITNNRIVRIGGVGIGNASSCGNVTILKDGKVESAHLWTRVYVSDNTVDHTGRNCIIARVSRDAIYERNMLANSSRYSTGHSIFNFDTDGIKIQYNEAYGNVGPGGKDRGGFDADYSSANTYIQYNYSHDNQWFCGIMKKPNHNVTIRHNISQNDRHGIYFYGFEKEQKASRIYIHNNTHFVSKDLYVKVFAEDRTPLNSTFEKNIFYFEGKGEWGEKAKGIGTLFRDNVYYGIPPHVSDKQAVTRGPKFRETGTAGTNIDLKTMKALSGYRLDDGSPCRGYGASLPRWRETEEQNEDNKRDAQDGL